MSPTVAILGGGVGGLSAAHHLAERGFDVTVYEAADRPGGKAQSASVPGTGEPGLPSEHGFRFFPGFYRHVVDTMEGIPAGSTAGSGTVADALVPTERTLIAATYGENQLTPTGTPRTPGEWLDALVPGQGWNLPPREATFLGERILELLTSCEARRRAELDGISWWEFLGADRMSSEYRALARSTRQLVAMDPHRASARSVGRIYVQLLRGTIYPSMDAERILNGPTSEVWIDPWVEHLESLGVEFVTGARATGFHVRDGDVVGATVDRGGDVERVNADHYVAAVPVEVMAELLDEELLAAAPSLSGVEHLDTAWMVGIQYYLREDVPLVRGHEMYADSPWALTSISQAQFWDVDLPARTDGEIEGILSVIVSDWTTPGILHERPAKACTPTEIAEEVWAQVCAHLSGVELDADGFATDDSDGVVQASEGPAHAETAADGAEATPDGAATAATDGAGRAESPNTAVETLDEVVAGWYLDPAIVEAEGGEGVENRTPLLLNTVGSLRHRPPANPSAGNLYLAADYVRTETDLASMEAADEAARRAVRAILADAGVNASPPELWEFQEPRIFAPLRAEDRVRFDLGLPHPGGISRSVQERFRRSRSD